LGERVKQILIGFLRQIRNIHLNPGLLG
jgi:hypothetical protein